MTKFTEELYLPGPNEPADVLPWGKSPEQTERDRLNAVARIGGFRQPSYVRAYLLAADTLLRTAMEGQTLDHHALPIFYLQRHAAELMIKDALLLGIEVQEYRKNLGIPSAAFPDRNQARRAEESHDLDMLLGDLVSMNQAMQLDPVPKVLRTVIKVIRSVENRNATWARYSTSKQVSTGAKTRQRHLQNEITIPLGAIQKQLQEASDALGNIWEFDACLMGTLGCELQTLWRQAGEIE